jgi:hypothetical protein
MRVRVTGFMRVLPVRLQIYVAPERLLRFGSSNEPLSPPWPRIMTIQFGECGVKLRGALASSLPTSRRRRLI